MKGAPHTWVVWILGRQGQSFKRAGCLMFLLGRSTRDWTGSELGPELWVVTYIKIPSCLLNILVTKPSVLM